MTQAKGGLNYAEYLELDKLLDAQHPQSDHPDELQFIVIHQVHELWFKLGIDYLVRARKDLEKGNLAEATRLLQQAIIVFRNTLTTVEQLHTLPPAAFHQFRALLAPGSGLQSHQFREVEFICGYRDPAHVEWVRKKLSKIGTWDQVAGWLNQPSINEVFTAMMTGRGIESIADLYAHPNPYTDVYFIAEALAELEHAILKWRFSHVQLVERTIGITTGTGGTPNEYLQMSLRIRLFPALWEGRSELTRRIGQI